MIDLAKQQREIVARWSKTFAEKMRITRGVLHEPHMVAFGAHEACCKILAAFDALKENSDDDK